MARLCTFILAVLCFPLFAQAPDYGFKLNNPGVLTLYVRYTINFTGGNDRYYMAVQYPWSPGYTRLGNSLYYSGQKLPVLYRTSGNLGTSHLNDGETDEATLDGTPTISLHTSYPCTADNLVASHVLPASTVDTTWTKGSPYRISHTLDDGASITFDLSNGSSTGDGLGHFGDDPGAPSQLAQDDFGILVYWPSSEPLDLGNGVQIPGYNGNGSAWAYVPVSQLDSEGRDWIAQKFPQGQVVQDNVGNDYVLAYYGQDGDLVLEQPIGQNSTIYNDPLTGNVNFSVDVDGFLQSVTLNGINGIDRHLTASLSNSISQQNDVASADPNQPVQSGQPTGFGSDVSIGSINPSISSGDDVPDIAPPSNTPQDFADNITVVSSTANQPRTDEQERNDAAGASFTDDDGSGLAGELAEVTTDNTRRIGDAAEGWLSFLSIDQLDPGVEEIRLQFDIPYVDSQFDWTMPPEIAALIRKLILWILYSAFWAGVTKKLMQ